MDRDDSGYETLFFPTLIRHPADVAKLRHALNSYGYDASYPDIQAAFSAWSESENAASWVGVDGMSDREMFEALWTRLERAGGLEHDDTREWDT